MKHRAVIPRQLSFLFKFLSRVSIVVLTHDKNFSKTEKLFSSSVLSSVTLQYCIKAT